MGAHAECDGFGEGCLECCVSLAAEVARCDYSVVWGSDMRAGVRDLLVRQPRDVVIQLLLSFVGGKCVKQHADVGCAVATHCLRLSLFFACHPLLIVLGEEHADSLADFRVCLSRQVGERDAH